MTGLAANDDDWIARCAARMLERDPLLLPTDVAALVEDMVTRSRWRTMRPEDAADLAFDPKPIKKAW